MFEYYSQTVFTYSFTGTSIVLYILCLITTCVSKVTTHVLLNVFINFFGWLAFLALSQHKISLLQLYFKLSTTTFIYFQKIFACVFSCVFQQRFKHTILALALSHWTFGRVLICHHHYGLQHELQRQGYCNYCWRIRFLKDLLDQDL